MEQETGRHIAVIARALSGIDIAELQDQAGVLEARLQDPSGWGDPASAGENMRSLSRVREQLDFGLSAHADAILYLQLAQGQDLEVAAEALACLQDLAARARRLMHAGGDGISDAIVTISAGAGGEDARDFVSMTLKETCLYAERSGFAVEIIDDNWEGHGLRDATIQVRGEGAYGMLRHEAGKRRIVRISEYGAGERRQTSFCHVDVLPDTGKSPEVEIRQEDLRIETYRDSGPGGQHRNKTDSAVRITHIPTGIQAKSAMKSQIQNREIAMATLKARIRAREDLLRQQEIAGLSQGSSDKGFGGHVRSLILNPYRLVRNEITGISSGDLEDYLSGGCDDVRC